MKYEHLLMTPEEAVELLRRFDGMIPNRRPLLQVPDVMEVLNVSDDHVRSLIGSRALTGLNVGAAGAKRSAPRVDRYSLLGLMLTRRML